MNPTLLQVKHHAADVGWFMMSTLAHLMWIPFRLLHGSCSNFANSAAAADAPSRSDLWYSALSNMHIQKARQLSRQLSEPKSVHAVL